MRKQFLTVALSMIVALAIVVPGIAAEKQYTFKIAHIEAAGGTGEAAFKYLKQILEERSKGRIKVTLYKGKSMAQSDTELGEIMRQNTVQMVPVPTHILSAMANIPQYSIFEFPYLLPTGKKFTKCSTPILPKAGPKRLKKKPAWLFTTVS
jgi:C4-dicarboxylate-binding protein DctP